MTVPELTKREKVLLPDTPPKYTYLKGEPDGKKYILLYPASIFSARYNKWVHLEAGFRSDGATGACDLPNSWSWWGHDKVCDDCTWADGTPCTAIEASRFLYDILDAEGRELRKFTWRFFTFLLGSWKIKKRAGWVPRSKQDVNSEGGA